MNVNTLFTISNGSTIPNGLPHPATLMTSQPQPLKTNKRPASSEQYHDNHYHRKSKVARLSPKTDIVVPTTPLLQRNGDLARMRLGYVLQQETDSAVPITPPSQAVDSLSVRQRRHACHDTSRPNHGLLQASKEKEMPPLFADQPLSSNTAVTAKQPVPQSRTCKQVPQYVRVERFSSRRCGDFIFKTRREYAKPLAQPRRSRRLHKDCDILRPSIEQEDPLWSARYEIAASTYKVTHACFNNLLSRSTFCLHEDVHPGVALALRETEKQLREDWPEEYVELAWEMRELLRSPLDRIPIVETLLDYLILRAGLAHLPGDEMLDDIQRDSFKATLEEKIDEHVIKLYAEGIEVEDTELVEEKEG